ncbi:MAG: carboxylating nicotinate-nucleotide diphosphorylase [Pelagibacteraceae bacterium]|nr:carboxylating nicotinate-nucleotide diphosphorylase [Pelagibacteraceae bacterium]PHX89404.1 MAG: nicotinate-nucleotide diphosphorylase (carboxylating) [Pelagibacteraceae bacterium]
MLKIKISKNFIRKTAKLALNEDLNPHGDITSSLIKNNKIIHAKIIANEDSVIAGLEFSKQTFNLIDNKIKFSSLKKEGAFVKKGTAIVKITGRAKNILIGERVALNFLAHLSGIATTTKIFKKLVGKKTKICCTRKTIPNMRLMQKYAVKIGGGTNHRYNLSDEYLIKDNHIASADIKTVVLRAISNKKGRKITVEVDNLQQLKKIIGLKFNRILFDNMKIKDIKLGIKMIGSKYETEASGNINLRNVKKYAATNVNRISIGSLTNSIKAIDYKLEI